MNISTSECSSGCESGWTMYLDQRSTNSTDPYFREQKGATFVNEDDQEDEDLSMVSDASSGPPHCHHYENYPVQTHYYDYQSSVSEDKRKSKQKSTKTKEEKQNNLCLDDTASSPIFHYSQDNVPPPDNHKSSGSHFEGESKQKKHLGFFKSSTKGKSGSLLGRKRQ
ncbi:hypothetical protein CDL12_24252 [Handroanthus impetiginosus]|uniref:Uncharacterized protein n=1 Tax=Handroanthus impetiginosus TaxID=429701 RepID=A0A2G9GD72_9LAMI|nr:hypothetical protein CDL12_24252 [Handroanthus impetiginosus]